jgi:hypothetical protein
MARHAAPGGLAARQRRWPRAAFPAVREDWRQDLRHHWREKTLLAAAVVTALSVAQTGGSGLLAQLVSAVFTAVLAVCFTVVVAVAMAGPHRAPRPVPVPRWHYLAAGVSWAGAAAGLLAGGLAARHGLGAGMCFGLAVWCAGIGLVMAGRAACWGRVRTALWLVPPPWLPPRHELAVPAPGGRPRLPDRR